MLRFYHLSGVCARGPTAIVGNAREFAVAARKVLPNNALATCGKASDGGNTGRIRQLPAIFQSFAIQFIELPLSLATMTEYVEVRCKVRGEHVVFTLWHPGMGR